jgi:hypothetical protein
VLTNVYVSGPRNKVLRHLLLIREREKESDLAKGQPTWTSYITEKNVRELVAAFPVAPEHELPEAMEILAAKNEGTAR